MVVKKQKYPSQIRKIKFKYYINYLEQTRPENKINHLDKRKIDLGSLKEDYEELSK